MVIISYLQKYGGFPNSGESKSSNKYLFGIMWIIVEIGNLDRSIWLDQES